MMTLQKGQRKTTLRMGWGRTLQRSDIDRNFLFHFVDEQQLLRRYMLKNIFSCVKYLSPIAPES